MNDPRHIVRLPARAPIRSARVDLHSGELPDRTNVHASLPRSRSKVLTMERPTDIDHPYRRRGRRHIDPMNVLSRCATLLLIPMLLIFPLAPALAADDEVTASVSSTEPLIAETTGGAEPEVVLPSTIDGIGDVIIEEVEVPPVTPEAEVPPEVEATPPEDGAVLGVGTTTEEGTGETPIADDSTTTPDAGVFGSGSGEGYADVATTTASTTETGDIVPPSSGSESGTSTDEVSASTTDEMTLADATSTDETLEEVSTEEAVLETPAGPSDEELARAQEEERVALIRQSVRQEVEQEYTKGCLTIDSVGYYCLKNPEFSSGGDAPLPIVTRVSLQSGNSGAHKQVFMTKGGVDIQLTNDSWDHAFPAFDVSGRSVVWQGNIDGRWQIFFADVAHEGTTTITQLTHSTESNFNPRVDGNDIVWQGWMDGNWEIFLATRDGSTTDPVGEMIPEQTRLGVDQSWRVTRITKNSDHDMFPSMVGGLVTWQAYSGANWNVYAYSMKTGATSKISADGTKSENPHFAITWDERSEDGGSRVVAYDIGTGKTRDLTNEARAIPDSVPYSPKAPISQDNQAALPAATGAATSSPSRDDGGDGGDDGMGTSTPTSI